jgi:hypothetical protein
MAHQMTNQNIRDAQKLLEQAACVISLAKIRDEYDHSKDHHITTPRASLGAAEGIHEWSN